MGENGWDLSDFINKYTSNSKPLFMSPAKTGHNDIFNDESLESESSPIPSKIERRNPHNENDSKFCTQENLLDRLNYLNQELTMFGFESIFPRDKNEKGRSIETLDLPSLINCTYELLKRQHLQAKLKDDLEERQLRSETDNEYLLQNQVRLKQDLENLKRESALLLCREREQIEKCRILSQDLKVEREEKRKLKGDVEHLKKQFYHESKRTEKEISRLKEKVHQLLNEKSMDRKIGIDILNSLQRVDGKRSTWKTAGKKNEEELYKMMIANYEDKEKKILGENQALRETIGEVQNMLTSIDTSVSSEVYLDVFNAILTQKYRKQFLPIHVYFQQEKYTVEKCPEEDARQLQLPYIIVKNDVETRFQYIISTLKERIDSNKIRSKQASPSATPEDTSSSFSKQATHEELLHQLQQCKAIITGQESIIQGMKEGYSKEAFEKALMTFGLSQENYEETETRLKSLKDEERKFNEERKNFTDYVLKISKEREEFEKERVEFYMHCLSTPVMNKDRKLHPRGHPRSSLRMVTPSFSPAPKIHQLSKSKQNTRTPPSTAELYKFMSLNYDGTVSRNLDRNLDGSFVQPTSSDTSPSPKKLQEHATNVRKAVESRHNKGIDEENRGTVEETGPLYMME